MATQHNNLQTVNVFAKHQIRMRAWDRRNRSWIDPRRFVCATSRDLLVSALASHWYELSQFTGLLDFNGKEIYEGDIVRTPDSGYRMVIWNVRGLWCLTSIESSADSVNLGLWELRRQDLEVVSNQYESPELLVP
jgi:hypothetical protein